MSGQVANAQGDAAERVAQDNLTAVLRLDKPMRPIEMADSSGKRLSLETLRGKNATLVAFLSFECPISNRQIPLLKDLANRYRPVGVSVIGVVCDAESPEELSRHIREFKIDFPVMHDPKKQVARHFLADTTPQVFLLDKSLVLRYFGAINDQYADRTTRLVAAKSAFAAEAIELILGGKDVVAKYSMAVGCPLVWEKPAAKKEGAVTFHRDIEPILQQHCQRCHRPNDVAPFSLLDYEDVLSWAEDIREFTAKRLMPPWPITGGLPLEGDISLSQKEIDLVGRWVEGGCPEGDRASAPQPVFFKSREEWDDLRPPDLVLKMPDTFHLAANGEDHYRTVVFPLNNTEELYISKKQFIPGNKKIVHHMLSFYDGTGMMLDAQKRLGKSLPVGNGDEDYGPGYESGMGLGFVPELVQLTRNKDNPGGGILGWVPGVGALENPADSRNVIPPGAAIFLQIHYHRSGKPETDSNSRIGIWFDKSKPKKYIQSLLADAKFITIPKGNPRFRAKGTREVPADGDLWFLAPHMHYLGKEFSVWHRPKDSEKRTLLLELKNWDFNWQAPYRFKQPFPMKAGDRVEVEAVYDNSPGNPNNPFSPPRTIFLGENTTDEMGFAVIGLTRDTRPEPGSDYRPYFQKILEVQKVKKLLGVKY